MILSKISVSAMARKDTDDSRPYDLNRICLIMRTYFLRNFLETKILQVSRRNTFTIRNVFVLQHFVEQVQNQRERLL